MMDRSGLFLQLFRQQSSLSFESCTVTIVRTQNAADWNRKQQEKENLNPLNTWTHHSENWGETDLNHPLIHLSHLFLRLVIVNIVIISLDTTSQIFHFLIRVVRLHLEDIWSLNVLFVPLQLCTQATCCLQQPPINGSRCSESSIRKHSEELGHWTPRLRSLKTNEKCFRLETAKHSGCKCLHQGVFMLFLQLVSSTLSSWTMSEKVNLLHLRLH